MSKVIVLLRGGLGNQLFNYAAGFRLAHFAEAELILDNVTFFKNDYGFNRYYLLDRFCISGRVASKHERLLISSRFGRYMAKRVNEILPFRYRWYIAEESLEYDPRLLHKKVRKSLFLDGYWQSEEYFRDVSDLIKEEFRLKIGEEDVNSSLCDKIMGTNSVCIHVRWFSNPPENRGNSPVRYYNNALEFIRRHVDNPFFFVFTDNIYLTKGHLKLPRDNVEYIGNPDKDPCHDFWLMTQCKHFIIANSTFSWWAAWLAQNHGKIIIAPKVQISGMGAWGFNGLIPRGWYLI